MIVRALLSALAIGTAVVATAGTPEQVAVGGILPDATMTGLTGHSRRLAEFRGRPLLINVWASWCGPCRKEMNSLERLFWRYGDKKLRVIGISTDDYVDRAKAFVGETRVSFANFIDQGLVLERMLGADKLPLTVLVDAEGRVLARFYGSRDWDGPEARELLARHFRIKP
jgi:thiol-disulfide isomerase/thioredoxin